MDSDYYETGKTILKNEKNMVLQNPNFQQSIIDRNKYYYQKSTDTLIIIYTICFFIYIIGAAIIYTYIIRYKPYSMVFKLIVLPLLITFPFYIFHFQRYLFMAMDYIYRYFLTYVFNDGYKFINKNVTQLILSTSKKNKELSDDDTSKGDASKGDKIRRLKLDDIGKTKKERDAADRLKKGDNTTYWTLVNSIKTIVTNYIETSDKLKPDELKPLDYATIYINDITSNDTPENIVILATISERILASYIWRIKQMQDQDIQDQDITDTWKTIAITILENDWLKTQITKQEIQSMRIKYAFDMIKLFDNKSTDPMIIQSIKTQINDDDINTFIGTNNLQIVTSHSIYALSLLMYKSNSLAYTTEKSKSKKILALSLIGKYAAYAYPQYYTFNTMETIQNTNLTGDVSLLNNYLISETNKFLEIKSDTNDEDIKNLIDLSIYIRKNAGQNPIMQLTSIVSAFETVINIILLPIDYNIEILYSILGNSYSIINPNQDNIGIYYICNYYLSLLNYIKTTATVSDVKTYFTPIIQYITNIYNLLPDNTNTLMIDAITAENCTTIVKIILSLTTTHMLIQCKKSDPKFTYSLKSSKSNLSNLSKTLSGSENINVNKIATSYEGFINYTSYGKIHPYTSKNTLSYSQL